MKLSESTQTRRSAEQDPVRNAYRDCVEHHVGEELKFDFEDVLGHAYGEKLG